MQKKNIYIYTLLHFSVVLVPFHPNLLTGWWVKSCGNIHVTHWPEGPKLLLHWSELNTQENPDRTPVSKQREERQTSDNALLLQVTVHSAAKQSIWCCAVLPAVGSKWGRVIFVPQTNRSRVCLKVCWDHLYKEAWVHLCGLLQDTHTHAIAAHTPAQTNHTGGGGTVVRPN